ncbi:MAG TPA: serine hydrolase, partial [Polyangia bacterium]
MPAGTSRWPRAWRARIRTRTRTAGSGAMRRSRPRPVVPEAPTAGPGGAADTSQPDDGACDRSRELARLVDPIAGEQLDHGKAAGAVVVVVMDGEVALTKGYGFADRDAGRPMTADATLVHM